MKLAFYGLLSVGWAGLGWPGKIGWLFLHQIKTFGILGSSIAMADFSTVANF